MYNTYSEIGSTALMIYQLTLQYGKISWLVTCKEFIFCSEKNSKQGSRYMTGCMQCVSVMKERVEICSAIIDDFKF